MTQEDISILRAIQKNAEMEMLAIATLADKVDDDQASYQLERQNLVLSSLHDQAKDKLLQAKQKLISASAMQEYRKKSEIHLNTLLDCSVSHIADLMIKNNTSSMISMQKVINHQKKVKYISKTGKEGQQSFAYEMAKEFMVFEEDCIERWKDFL